ncbi:hypothetical protein Tco_1410664 [Tanacetum coccineum]
MLARHPHPNGRENAMWKTRGQPKKKKAKKDAFNVNFNYDGLFTSCPMIYFQGEMKVLTDTNFNEMSYEHLLEIVKRLVPKGFEKVYYCKTGAKLIGIREIKSDQDITDMLKVGYDNNNKIDMFVDHFGYDIMKMVKWDINEEMRKNRIKAELESSDDDYDYSDDDLKQIENVDFYTEGDDNVVIKNISTQDPFLTKLCSSRVLFMGNVDSRVDRETPQVDTDDNQIDSVYKVLVYCGRNVVEGRCAGKKCNKHRVMPNKVRTCLLRGIQGNHAGKKVVKKKPVTQSGEGTSQSPKWIKKNNNLGSLVTYKWIAMQFFKEIIEDPFMPLRKMRDDIRQKFMIDVSVGQHRQALLDSNPGSTCTLNVVECDNGSVSFKRMYICFKGVKDGWLARCRKLIGLDGCFLNHTCKGELLIAIGRDANNQMYPIAWAVELQSYQIHIRRCAAFENGISESFNRAILGPRQKPIIAMLEEIRLYIMQRLVSMNKIAFSLEDRISPSIRKRLELLKEKQRLWELSGVPCVHAVVAYMHVGSDIDVEVILIDSTSSELECSSTSELECSSTSELEFLSSDELGLYLSSFDEFDSSDEFGSLEKSVSRSLKKSVSQIGPSKDLLNWYEDEKDEVEKEKGEEDGEEDDEIDEEADDGKDDSDDELWSPKSIRTSKSLRSPKMKGASSKSTPTTKKLVVKSSEPIRNCIIGLANKITQEMIVNKTFGVKKEQVKEQVNEDKKQVKKGKRKLGV